MIMSSATAHTSLTVVLVHGAWHGPWCWSHQTPELEKLGFRVEKIHLPSSQGTPGKTQFDDATAVRNLLEHLLTAGQRVVVLAHSYSGPIACSAIRGLSEEQRAQSGLSGGVVGLIHLCAYIFPGGMDQGAVIKSVGGLPYVTWDSPSEGLFVLNEPRVKLYLPDVPEDRIAWTLPQLTPQSSAANTGIVPPQAWQDDSHYSGRLGYIRCTADGIVPIADQDTMINAASATNKWVIRSLDGAGHSPFLSRPQDVAVAVQEIVQEFEQAA